MSAHKQDALHTLGAALLFLLLSFLGKQFLLRAPDSTASSGSSATAPKQSRQRVESVSGTFEGTYKVVGISDGDTIDILKDEKRVRLRFAEVDTPEKGQPFGTRAKDALSGLIGGKDVRVVVKETDRYGRSIAHIYSGDVWVNEWMVAQGFAWHYKAFSDNAQLAALETEARQARRGLWSDPRRVEPWNWRKLAKADRDKYR